ncbi:hypothetical protein PPERSA_04327 [Pseudocohnilembus persalinus]|uniref:Uncharacterized protein n=1 Tax=Pseudocohnilembus persalinus TaxID=266149 RepID=A0A0V0QR63_PSEPJ|nr:hypothetical protein PPERSA_04327 [Pseudocohnilembus persalinus]|eukprot:KRX04512.1 hypothetical protein PPERSA_04327 [Pseudocohnilembus persalinus]
MIQGISPIQVQKDNQDSQQKDKQLQKIFQNKNQDKQEQKQYIKFEQFKKNKKEQTNNTENIDNNFNENLKIDQYQTEEIQKTTSSQQERFEGEIQKELQRNIQQQKIIDNIKNTMNQLENSINQSANRAYDLENSLMQDSSLQSNSLVSSSDQKEQLLQSLKNNREILKRNQSKLSKLDKIKRIDLNESENQEGKKRENLDLNQALNQEKQESMYQNYSVPEKIISENQIRNQKIHTLETESERTQQSIKKIEIEYKKLREQEYMQQQAKYLKEKQELLNYQQQEIQRLEKEQQEYLIKQKIYSQQKQTIKELEAQQYEELMEQEKMLQSLEQGGNLQKQEKEQIIQKVNNFNLNSIKKNSFKTNQKQMQDDSQNNIIDQIQDGNQFDKQENLQQQIDSDEYNNSLMTDKNDFQQQQQYETYDNHQGSSAFKRANIQLSQIQREKELLDSMSKGGYSNFIKTGQNFKNTNLDETNINQSNPNQSFKYIELKKKQEEIEQRKKEFLKQQQNLSKAQYPHTVGYLVNQHKELFSPTFDHVSKNQEIGIDLKQKGILRNKSDFVQVQKNNDFDEEFFNQKQNQEIYPEQEHQNPLDKIYQQVNQKLNEKLSQAGTTIDSESQLKQQQREKQKQIHGQNKDNEYFQSQNEKNKSLIMLPSDRQNRMLHSQFTTKNNTIKLKNNRSMSQQRQRYSDTKKLLGNIYNVNSYQNSANKKSKTINKSVLHGQEFLQDYQKEQSNQKKQSYQENLNQNQIQNQNQHQEQQYLEQQQQQQSDNEDDEYLDRNVYQQLQKKLNISQNQNNQKNISYSEIQRNQYSGDKQEVESQFDQLRDNICDRIWVQNNFGHSKLTNKDIIASQIEELGEFNFYDQEAKYSEKNAIDNLKQEANLRNLVKNVKEKVRVDVENPEAQNKNTFRKFQRKNFGEVHEHFCEYKNQDLIELQKQKKIVREKCIECQFLLNRGLSTKYCEKHGELYINARKKSMKSKLPKRLAQFL